MKKFILPFVILTVLIQSCAPVYQCGDSPEKSLKGSKRLKATVAQRDSLCSALDAQKSVSAELTDDIESITMSLVETDQKKDMIQADYENLLRESTSDQAELSKKLQDREITLRDREKDLSEMRAIIARQDSITSKLNNTLRKALLGFNSDELTVDVKNGKVYVSMSDKLMFKSGAADMEQKGAEALELLAKVLVKNPDIDVLVEGHTDNIPIKTAVYKDNWDLSVARAASVVRVLTWSYKVDPKQVMPAGRGAHFPKGDNATPEGRAMNRRTEIVLSPRLDEVMDLLNAK